MHRRGAKRAIKLDRRFIPIEHGPFHPAAAAITRNLRKLDEQCTTITFATPIRLHEQIFKVKPGPPKPRGKIVKVNSEPDCRFSFKPEKNSDTRPPSHQ